MPQKDNNLFLSPFVLSQNISNSKGRDVQRGRLTLQQLWSIAFIVWTAIAIFHYVQFYLEHVTRDDEFLWLPTTAEFIVNYYSWVAIAAAVVWLGKRFRPQRGNLVRPLTIHFCAAVVFAVLHLGIIAAVLQFVKPYALPGLDYADKFVFAALQLFHFECMLYGVVLVLSYGFENYAAESAVTATDSPPRYLMKLSVKDNGHTLLLNIAQIDWLEAADNYVNIHSGKNSYLLREKMHVLETKLNPRHFQRVHRSAIVNVERVKALLRGENGSCSVLLENGQNLPVSRRRRERIQHSINRLI
jgi:two-component system LytT family response regulator